MNREELIEEAAKEAGEAAWGVYWLAIPAAFREQFVHDAEIAWAVFEKAQAPTEEEREALIGRFVAVMETAMTDSHFVAHNWNCTEEDYAQSEAEQAEAETVRDLVFAALRRPAQTEPTDEEREALAQIEKRITHAFGGPHMDEFKNDPPTRKHYAVADAILAAGFRRPAQTEPTDAQIEAVADSIESFFEEHVQDKS